MAQLKTPVGHDCLYRLCQLPNGIVVLLVHDPNTDHASASMDVRVGWYSDPKEYPGLAHLVEHVVHFRSKKGSEENTLGRISLLSCVAPICTILYRPFPFPVSSRRKGRQRQYPAL